MDVAMPEMDGVEATRAITRTLPEVRVLGLSMHRERGTERKMLAAGALGYVVKDAPVEELVTAIRRAGMSSRSSAVGETTDAKPPDDDAS
jgi:DNA-binding NarL/FixJ family response regulator